MNTALRCLLLFAVLMPVTGYADGNELLKRCGTTVARMDDKKAEVDNLDLGYCLGLMQGVTGVNMIYQTYSDKYSYKEILQFCAPENGIGHGQAARIVVKYLKEHPEILHENEVIVSVKALGAAFPCK